MIESEWNELFNEESVEKQVEILCDDGILTNTVIYSEEMEISESLCEEPYLSFGACVSNAIKFTTANTSFRLEGNAIRVRMYLDGDKEKYFPIGVYKVQSAQFTAGRSKREVVAYDVLRDVLTGNYADWYNSLPYPVKLKEFRDSFFQYIGIEQEEIVLVNDDVTIDKTIDTGELRGAAILQAICVLNGAFGHMTRENRFRYIVLNTYSDYMYPSSHLYPKDALFPTGSTVNKRFLVYRECTYEDYEVRAIDKVQIRQNEEDVGVIFGTGTNAFIVQDNFLVYGKSAADLEDIAERLFLAVSNKPYIPMTTMVNGNPCMEVGDIIKIHTTDGRIISSYIMQRVLKGVQALADQYRSQGSELQSEQVATVNTTVTRLKGSIASVRLTVDGIQSRVESIEDGSASVIEQLSNSISAKVSSTGGNSSFSWHLQSDKFELKSGNNVVFKCDANGISVAGTATASDIYALNGRIGNLEADRVTTAQLNAVSGKIDTLSAKSITTDNFTSQKITSGMIDSGVISAGKITTGTLSADRLNVSDIVGKLTTQTITVVKVDCTANITAPTGNITSCGISTLNGVAIGSLYVQNGYLRV